jgi:hypothetical protein
MEIKSNIFYFFYIFILTPESESTHLVTLYTRALDICSLLAHGLQLTSKWPFFNASCIMHHASRIQCKVRIFWLSQSEERKNWPSMSRNVSLVNGQTDRLASPCDMLTSAAESHFPADASSACVTGKRHSSNPAVDAVVFICKEKMDQSVHQARVLPILAQKKKGNFHVVKWGEFERGGEKKRDAINVKQFQFSFCDCDGNDV